MPSMPRDPAFDSTLSVLSHPYHFISKRCHQLGSDVFFTRVLLRPTICMTGAKAAELFYDARYFSRLNAAPEPVRATLLGKGSVQGLDGLAHQDRKAMFLHIVAPQHMARLFDEVSISWAEAARKWQQQKVTVLYEATQQLLTQAVCRWAGVPVPPEELLFRTHQLAALFDEAGSSRHFHSRYARIQAQRWIAGIIANERTSGAKPNESALSIIAHHRDTEGRLLSQEVAAVELLNILRPIIASSVFIVCVAHALHFFPAAKAFLKNANTESLDALGQLDAFVQEVRRYYPFVPFIAARTLQDFEWEGISFKAGLRTLLDIYGTNHDPAVWKDPEQFRPDRFTTEKITAFNFIPQGGGDVRVHHRCPGENIAMEVMKISIDYLMNRLNYQVPPQNLQLNMRRLPALPYSKFEITDVVIK